MGDNVAAAWRSGGGTLKFGRETKLHISTKFSASIHPA